MSKQTPKVPGANTNENTNDQAGANEGDGPTMAEMQAQINLLKSQIEKQNAPKVNKRDDRSALPNAEDIDVASLKHAVLTKSGWICPLKQQNPNTMR